MKSAHQDYTRVFVNFGTFLLVGLTEDFDLERTINCSGRGKLIMINV